MNKNTNYLNQNDKNENSKTNLLFFFIKMRKSLIFYIDYKDDKKSRSNRI